MEKSITFALWPFACFDQMNFAWYEKLAKIQQMVCEVWTMILKNEVKETSSKLSLVHVVWNQAHGWFLFLQQQPRGVFLHQGGKVKNNIRRNNDLDHSSTMRFLCQSVPFLSPIRTNIGDFADPREGGRRHCDKRKDLRCIFKHISLTFKDRKDLRLVLKHAHFFLFFMSYLKIR